MMNGFLVSRRETIGLCKEMGQRLFQQSLSSQRRSAECRYANLDSQSRINQLEAASQPFRGNWPSTI
jgi:hypothetical protein